MVGYGDVTSASPGGQAWDVRVEGTRDAITVAYHRSGEWKVGGAYTLGL